FVEAHCSSPSVTLSNVTIENTATLNSDIRYLNADLFITGTNGGIYSNITIRSVTLNGLLMNNFTRTVGNCNPVQMVNNIFSNISITRLVPGNFINLQ